MKFLASLGERFREGLSRTRETLQDGFDRVFKGQELDTSTLESLEEVLLEADLGVETTEEFVEAVRDQARRGRLTDGDVRHALVAHLQEVLKGAAAPLALEERPAVLLILGVNGSGKTTTCG
ncbi:MAG: signal recognition particle receptor subunit alpha, partial [Candidatus Rokuibacteriota bacterium]